MVTWFCSLQYEGVYNFPEAAFEKGIEKVAVSDDEDEKEEDEETDDEEDEEEAEGEFVEDEVSRLPALHTSVLSVSTAQ